MQLGADEPDAARARDLQHVIFEGTALGSRFAVASGDEHRRADACAAAGAQGLDDGRARHRDDGQVDR